MLNIIMQHVFLTTMDGVLRTVGLSQIAQIDVYLPRLSSNRYRTVRHVVIVTHACQDMLQYSSTMKTQMYVLVLLQALTQPLQ